VPFRTETEPLREQIRRAEEHAQDLFDERAELERQLDAQGMLARRGPWRWLLLSVAITSIGVTALVGYLAGDLAATKRRIASELMAERAKKEARADIHEQLRVCRQEDAQRQYELADCRATAALPHGPGLPRQVP
jgi:hypothetical protein